MSGKMPHSKRISIAESDEDDDIGRSPDPIDLANLQVSQDAAIKLHAVQQEKEKPAESEQQTPKQEGRLSVDQFDVSTKEGFKELLRFQLRIFD